MFPHKVIQTRLHQALGQVLPDADVSSLLVRPCPDARFGDYQATAVMSLARQRKLNPRQLASDVLANLDVSDVCDSVEIAGPGFLNFRLQYEALVTTLQEAAQRKHLFFEPVARPRRIVIDFSSPNVAKPMHVGHIRSTILGDCLARVCRLLGHSVITDNHIGDWGTQFGKLILGWKTHLDAQALQQDPIAELERLYRQTNTQTESDPDLLQRARQELVQLQAGDADNLVIWQQMGDLSRTQFDTIYRRLGVGFDQTLGESFYNAKLQGVVDGLLSLGIARESEGAVAIFFDDDPQLKGSPSIIRKSDGAFNYTTTDLATLTYRVQKWNPDEIIYVTDGRQQLHFQQVFSIWRRWHPKSIVQLVHVWFGSILGQDGKPFKTRTGETVKLADLLDEAEERALAVVTNKNPDMPEDSRHEIARIVGIGAVKYADLLPNRQTDYVFGWEKMLSLSGNTAPYLQYSYARIQSIFRRGNVSTSTLAQESVRLSSSDEISLAKHLLNFGLVIESVAEEQRPNYLCNYLYELSGLFTRFYENCPVLKAEKETKSSRLVLCLLTARVLRQGLDVLGIECLDQM